MANVFLDLGTHYGQGLESFIKSHNIDESWIVHTFEANSKTFDRYMNDHHHKYPYVITHNKAVYDHDGVIKINYELPPGHDDTGQGSSIIDLDKWNPWKKELGLNFVPGGEIECIDFSKFITDNFKKDDNIIVKMDIEGSEFDIIQKLIDTNVIEYINEISIEWHDHYYTNVDEMSQKKEFLIEQLKQFNVIVKDWH